MDGVSLSWARDVLRFSLIATSSSRYPFSTDTVTENEDTTNPEDPGKDPRFRRLVEAILFSRRFIVSYNVVLLAILLVFTTWHWGEKIRRARKRRLAIRAKRSGGKSLKGDTPEGERDEAWSSSSSTIEGTATPPDATKADDERRPLLSGQQKDIGERKSVYNWTLSWMVYQPRPVPIINKTLPPNQVSLAVLALIGLNIFYTFYETTWSIRYLFVFADRCGLVFVANLPLLYLLAAKNQPIKILTGYSYESLNIFHRRLGELMCLEALLHFLGMFGTWFTLLRYVGISLGHFLSSRLVLLGLFAFLAYELIYFTSLGSFRQRWYEIFLAAHIILQIAGLILLWFHHHSSRPYVGVSLGIYLIDRLVFRLFSKITSLNAALTVLPDNETVLLSSNWDLPSSQPLLPQSTKHGWSPASHVFLTIPALSKKHIFQAHPFTIYSGAPNNQSQHAWFSLLIRAQSGFTRSLLSYARSHSTTRIRVDGPYGASHAEDTLRSADQAIIVAGGSGIAVAYPLLWALLSPTSSTPDTESGISNRTKVKLLWIVHSSSHLDWFPEEKRAELNEWGLEVFVAGPTGEVGRPDVNKILRGWVEEGRVKSETGVVVSGPDGLVRDVRNACAGMVGQGKNVKLAIEKFGW